MLVFRRHVTERDLTFFKRHCESDQPLEGATRWELQMDKEFPTFSYTAWRRVLPVRGHPPALLSCSCPDIAPALCRPFV